MQNNQGLLDKKILFLQKLQTKVFQTDTEGLFWKNVKPIFAVSERQNFGFAFKCSFMITEYHLLNF